MSGILSEIVLMPLTPELDLRERCLITFQVIFSSRFVQVFTNGMHIQLQP